MLGEVVKGLALTLKHAFRRPVTIQYPDERDEMPRGYRGLHKLLRWEDGLERCVGCKLCAAACPADCIYVESAENTPERRVSKGERYASVYEINELRCIYCGFCEEACPVGAVVLGGEYEYSAESREEFLYTREDLLVKSPRDYPELHARYDERKLLTYV
ncbi:MAG: NADH-quinone oxidoreductase subunit NuoI [Nitrospinota bacterium]